MRRTLCGGSLVSAPNIRQGRDPINLDFGIWKISARAMESQEGPAPSSGTGLIKALGVVLCAIGILAAYALFFSQHFPSPLAIDIGLASASVVAVITGWESRNGGTFGASSIHRSAWVRVPLIGTIWFVLALLGVRDGLFAVVTASLGSPAVRHATVAGVRYSNRTCDGFKTTEARWLFNGALCAPAHQLARAHPGDTLILEGVQSSFGMNVGRLSLRERRQTDQP